MRYLGTFPSEEEAARAFDQEAIRLRGTGIELNLPHEAEGFMHKLRAEEEALAAAGNQHPLAGVVKEQLSKFGQITSMLAKNKSARKVVTSLQF